MSAAADATSTEQPGVWTRIRLADRRDVPNIHRLIHQMAEFEILTDLFSATESSLSSTLFPSPPLPPFRSFTVLILELSPSPIPSAAEEESNPGFRPILSRIALKSTVEDPEALTFASPRGDGLVVAGFVLCFPNYSTFMALPGIYVEDIFVREAWRRLGMGTMMLAAVAREAARMGCGRVEWCVLDWNKNAIAFYEEMGAEVLPQWRICRLTGDALSKYAVDEDRWLLVEEMIYREALRQFASYADEMRSRMSAEIDARVDAAIKARLGKNIVEEEAEEEEEEEDDDDV